jgi:hypothetical protein
MTWLGFFTGLWTLILGGVAIFVVVDARNAYDGDEETPTLSGYIKAWRRQEPYRTPLLGACVCSLVLVPLYLFAHLVLEAI